MSAPLVADIGSYMSAHGLLNILNKLRNTDKKRGLPSILSHGLLNLLNKLRNRDKKRGLPSILSLFRNKFNKFNNIGTRILDSIYHMTLTLLENCIFGVLKC